MSVFFFQDRISRTPITIFVFKEKTVTLNQKIDKYAIKTHVTYIHTYTCTYIHTHEHTYIHTHAHACQFYDFLLSLVFG